MWRNEINGISVLNIRVLRLTERNTKKKTERKRRTEGRKNSIINVNSGFGGKLLSIIMRMTKASVGE